MTSARSTRSVALVVDDDRDVALLVIRHLESLGFDAREVPPTGDVVKALQGASADLIFCDILLPGIEGTDVVLALRRAGHRTPVVLITGERDASTVVAAFRAGASDVLLKPFGREEVKAAVRRTLGARELAAPPVAAEQSAPPPSPPESAADPSPIPESPSGAHDRATRSLALKIAHVAARADAQALPVPPRIVARLAQMCEDDADDRTVDAVLQSSATLSAAVLRAAGTADVGAGRPAPTSVHEAVLRLGTSRAIHNALAAAQRANYALQESPIGGLLSRLWVRHFLTAATAGEIARRAYGADAARTQTLLMFSEVGEVMALRALHTFEPNLLGTDAVSPSAVAAVREIHASLGETLLKRWGMPVTFGLAAAHHVSPPAQGLPESVARPLALARLAGHHVDTLVPTGLWPGHAPRREDAPLTSGIDSTLMTEAGRAALQAMGELLGSSRDRGAR